MRRIKKAKPYGHYSLRLFGLRNNAKVKEGYENPNELIIDMTNG